MGVFAFQGFLYNIYMSVLQQIFEDHFNEIISDGIQVRDSVIENVQKMTHCGDYSEGYAIYECGDCGALKTVPFRCKSRFCSTCGYLYSARRSMNMSFKLVKCNHRHCVFTIPKQLRPIFYEDRSFLNELFLAVRDVIYHMFYKLNKSQQFTPGFICVLHTFGRDLKWNPHIHVLLSEGATGKTQTWRKVTHFNYHLLRKSFQMVLLRRIAERIPEHRKKDFKKTMALLYREYPDGFYVRAKPTLTKSQDVIDYIGRYLGRPVIAASRILDYDGQMVTFKYLRHEDDQLVVEKVTAKNFILRLIIHIPQKHFKMIRYYGIYASPKKAARLNRAVSEQLRRYKKRNDRWRIHFRFAFDVDPLKCACGNYMTFLQCRYPNKNKTPLNKSYKELLNSS